MASIDGLGPCEHRPLQKSERHPRPPQSSKHYFEACITFAVEGMAIQHLQNYAMRAGSHKASSTPPNKAGGTFASTSNNSAMFGSVCRIAHKSSPAFARSSRDSTSAQIVLQVSCSSFDVLIAASFSHKAINPTGRHLARVALKLASHGTVRSILHLSRTPSTTRLCPSQWQCASIVFLLGEYLI